VFTMFNLISVLVQKIWTSLFRKIKISFIYTTFLFVIIIIFVSFMNREPIENVIIYALRHWRTFGILFIFGIL